MKRRILLLMMTALLSVGAGAQTVTIFENAEGTAVGYNASLSLNDAKQQLRSARVGSQLIITLSVPSAGANVYLYGSDYGYKTELWGGWQNEMNGSLSCLLTADAISAINNDAEGYGLWIGGGASFTVTKVTLSYNEVHLFSDYSPNMWNLWDGVKDMKTYIAQASANDLLSFSFSEVVDWGGSLLFTSGQGNPGDDPKTESTPTIYYSVGSLSTSSKTYIPLTDELLEYSSLFLSGQGYTASSVDLIYQPSAVNIGSTGYATFGYPFAVDLSGLSEGQDAYTVTVNGDKAQLTSVKGNKIPANTGIILKGTSGDKISLPLTTTSTDVIGTNDLQVSDGTVTGDENGTIYVLANGGSNGVGFYPVVNGSAITAGKAYLKVSGENAARQFIGFGDDNGATGIDSLTPALSKGEEVYYDLQGRRVAQPTKGLYIVNGKKVIIK